MQALVLSLAVAFVVAPLGPAQPAPANPPVGQKRPMTFEDMMKMKRLGETAVSPGGKWLAYSVTTVDLDQNSKTAELWLQRIEGGEPMKLTVAQPGDSGPQFSPDGKRILFLSARDGGHQQIFMADFDSATGATSNQKRVTFIWSQADNALWAPDGKSIVFTSEVYPDCPAIRIDDFATGDSCNIDRDEAREKSKVKAQIFTHLLYRHWDHYTGDKRSHLMQVMVDVPQDNTDYWVRDLTPNDPHDVPPFSMEGGGGFAISPDSKELAFTENPDAQPATSVSAQIYTLDLTNPAAKPVKVSTSAGGNFNPAYSPDGKWLAWRSEARAGYEADKFRLVIYDRAGMAIRNMLPGLDRWVDEFAWAPDSETVFFTAGDAGEESVFRGEIASGVPARLGLCNSPDGVGGEFSDLHVSADGKSLIASRMTARAPGEAVAVDFSDRFTCVTASTPPIRNAAGAELTFLENHAAVKEGKTVFLRQLTHLNDALLARLDRPDMEPFWFYALDKAPVEGFLIKPPGFDPAKKYPVKLLIHGGPQGAWGDAWSYRWNAELFAANGYVVIMINPRGSTGYGQAFVDGVNGDWGGKPFTDLMTGLDYAEEHFQFIDKTRECALGASYGGYMANWILGHTNRFKCIVSHDGMFDAESAFGSTEEDWFNIWEFKFPNTQGGHPWDYYGKPDSENPFRKWSPSLSAKNFRTPTLVVHGQLDYRLDVSEGFQLFDTLQLLKVPSKMLYFPDEGHWVLKPQNSQLWYKTVNDWVDEWTKSKD
jgi:dipeptidyl aminopeptidase/acylaminoacyl peptidase